MATTAKNKRGPTVLVTDAREHPVNRTQQLRNTSQRLTVDSILGYAPAVPSAQRRTPQRPAHLRTPSGRHPLDPKLSGRLVPHNVPTRTSKVSEKLVLLPETEGDDDDDEKAGFGEEEGPPTDDTLQKLRSPVGALKDKSFAERMPKAKRTEKLARVTAYCTAQGYKMRATADFFKTQHGARTKLYDDCLYCVYHLPLLPGTEGYRVRSSPILKSPGGKYVLDEEIERNERNEYREGYFGETDEFGVPILDAESPHRDTRSEDDDQRRSEDDDQRRSREQSQNDRDHAFPESPKRSVSPSGVSPDAYLFGEMFIFSYGVTVFWNFTERQEKDILADLTFSTSETGISLVSRPQKEEDFETEEFHFEYNPEISRPRMFNDMITLKSGDHMIKLAMSHAIAQSTKLSFFEERMAHTMMEAQYVPRRLALTGKLGMKREDVVKILGRLFTSRVDVNLSSNMLDVPGFFWDAEPTLHPLYIAVREYLEIKPRVQVLNERCQVFLDLAEILSDAIAEKKMTRITWIIIILILMSILVTCTEVFLRFGILAGNKHKGAAGGTIVNGLSSDNQFGLFGEL